MKRKGLCSISLALALTLLLSLGAPALAGEEAAAPSREELTLAAVNAAVQYGGATAGQYALWVDGEITLSGTVGVYSKTENRALLESDLFGIGSVSKVYTTAAMMLLMEQGKVNLDAPVTAYLPDFKMADERYRDITVRMLLNHSSGLMGGSTGDAFLFADTEQTATKDLLNRLSTQRLKAAPGEIAVYCNDGFTLAELVIEAVSGQTYGEFLHERILKPAGLENTFVPQDEFDTGRLVKTYASPTETRPLPQDTLGIVGCGGIYASASDLAAFGGALTGEGLLSKESRKAMENPEYLRGIWPEDDADMIAYGLGWDSVKVYPFALDKVQALSKGGDTQFYHAALVVIPEYRMAAAVLTSGGVSTYNQMAAAKMLTGALKEKGISITETAPALPTATPAEMPASLAEFSGPYGAFSQQMEITIADNKLTIQSLTIPALPPQIFSYYSDGTFRDESGQSIVKPVTEKNGLTYLYQKGWGEIPGLGLMPVSNYLGEKMPENPIAPELQSAWDATSTTSVLPVNMKYTNQLYATFFAQSAAAAAMGTPKYVPGYMGALRIIDENAARSELRIPNIAGRDSQDITLYEENGIPCQTSTQGIVYASADRIAHDIYTGDSAYCTIQENGWARWFTVAEGDVGKTVTVTVPENAGFYVYDATGAVTASSVAYGDTTAVLPENGMLVFIGDPSARFALSFE